MVKSNDCLYDYEFRNTYGFFKKKKKKSILVTGIEK